MSKITDAIRQERRERFEQQLYDQHREDWREYIAAQKPADDRRNDVTGY